LEKYKHNVKVRFDRLPPIEFKSFQPDSNVGFFERLAIASQRRHFSLEREWAFELGDVDYENTINGKIIIPRFVEGKVLYFDGASIPFHWLISALTIGILRPLGVMLIASIVHDFAYKFGYLIVEKRGVVQKHSIERDIADKLFRDIIASLNKLPVVAFFGWLFVRLGWLLVRYNQKRFGGKPPYWEIPLALSLLALLGYLLLQHTTITCIIALLVYAGIYLYQKRLN